MLSQSIEIASLSMFFHLGKKLHGFRFMARFRRIIIAYGHLNRHSDHLVFCLNETSPLEFFAEKSHHVPPSSKGTVTSFATPHFRK